ncbi:HTH-type transcriptional activator RhaS [compost metagenome]
MAPSQVAQGCGVSVAYLHRILRAGGLSVESFIFELRLEKCRELLLDARHRHRSIAELAYQVGFSHPSHFSRLFKQRFGMTPRDLRAGGRTTQA